MESIKITLETLYDILRNEKKREDLQKLESSFFADIVGYLKEKRSILESKDKSDDLFAAGERDKLEYELRSIKRILKEIYEKREKKIIEITLNKSKTGSDLIDTSAMLKEEKEFHQRLLEVLGEFRKGILLQLFKGELPLLDRVLYPTKEKTLEPKVFSEEEAKPVEDAEEKKEEVGLVKVRFVHPMPSFVWKDMKVYGPYEKEEETEIFPEVAELLVRKGRVEMV